MLHRTDPQNLTFWVLESFNCPQPRACVCLAASAAFCVRSSIVEQRWGQFRVACPQLCSCYNCARRHIAQLQPLVILARQFWEHSAWLLLMPMMALMEREFNQCWTLENSIHRRDIEDQGGKHQPGGLESDWQWDEINNVRILGCSAAWFQT